MSNKHTPAPWIASGVYVQALYTPTDGGKPFYRDIARTDTNLSTPDESAATAQLIAAAPDLLAALNGLTYALMHHPGVTLPAPLATALERSIAAIEKARGQS
jgi:hypothetical protein